eukprot:3910462-Rhodomonas_salina.1
MHRRRSDEHRWRVRGLPRAPFLRSRSRLLHRVDEPRSVRAAGPHGRPDAFVDTAALLLDIAILDVLGIELDLAGARCALVLAGPAAAHPHAAAAQVLQLQVQRLATVHELDPVLGEHRQIAQAQRLEDQDQERCKCRLDWQLLAEQRLGDLILDRQVISHHGDRERVVAVGVGEDHGSEAHRQRRRRPER